MKLQVTQENLSRALGNVARVAVASRNPLPILNSILLRTIDSRLSVVATNLEIAITECIGAKVLNEGAIAVPARLMQEFVTSLPAGNIELELKDHRLSVKTDQYESTINGTSADEFPVVPSISKSKVWQLPATALKKALQQVLFAASGDETRPVLTGVYIHTFEGQLYAVATDSYRLAEKRLLATKDDVSLLVPATALSDLLRILGDQAEVVHIRADDQQVLFTIGDIELVSRLIDGNYPDYRKLLPKRFEVSATLSRQDFANVTKVSSLFARESAGSVTIHVDEGEAQLSISSVASQLGENTSKAKAVVKGNGDVTVNSRFLIDGLQAVGGDQVTFAFNGKLEPCVLRSPGADDYLHIVMPLKS